MWSRRRNTLLSALCTAVLCTSRHAVHASSAGAAASAAVSALKNIDARYFVAGGVCAATSHGITTPLDVVKTKMQASPDVYDKGVYSSALSICKTDGPQALLGGLGPTVVGYGVEGAMKFGVYEVLKPVFSKLLAKDGVDQTTTFAYICASVVAGAVASLLLCPMEFTRIRIVTDPNYKGDNMMQAFHKLIQENGVLSTFGGMSAMLSKQVRAARDVLCECCCLFPTLPPKTYRHDRFPIPWRNKYPLISLLDYFILFLKLSKRVCHQKR